MENFTILNKTIVLCAKRNTGKSRLLRYLVLCESDKFDENFLYVLLNVLIASMKV